MIKKVQLLFRRSLHKNSSVFELTHGLYELPIRYEKTREPSFNNMLRTICDFERLMCFKSQLANTYGI